MGSLKKKSGTKGGNPMAFLQGKMMVGQLEKGLVQSFEHMKLHIKVE